MEALKLTVEGLYTDPNPLSAVPNGGLSIADDAAIYRPMVGESRRGQERYGLLLAAADKFYSFEDTLLAHYGTSLVYDANGNGTVFTPYSGTFASPDGIARPRSFEENQNFYLTTELGIQKLQTITGTFIMAGAPPGLGGSYTLSNPGFMSNNVQIAYRIVWGYLDLNGNEIIGAPSPRMIVLNDTGDTANVDQTWQIPVGVLEGWFYRVYRSAESAGIIFPPDDELGQVKQAYVTGTDISSGFVTFTDIVPNGLRGAALYTNPSQQGILQANEQPPFSIDVCAFRGRAFYANTRIKQRYFGTLIAVGDNTLGGEFGYQTNDGDTHTDTTIDNLTKAASIVIQDLTYTADLAGVAGNGISIAYTGGGTAGAEVVTVNGNAISVQIQSGVSTATQVKAAVDGDGSAAALVDVAISGSGSNPQVIQAQTYLTDGFDTTYLNVGMRVVGTGVQAGTTIVSIDSSSSITVTPATTATATVALEFQDRFSINDMDYWAASSADYNNRQFVAVLDQTPGTNIELTAINLISAINQDPNNSIVSAYYTSNAGELPGGFLLQGLAVSSPSFYITSTNGESFSPQLPLTDQTQLSSGDDRQNRIFFSKLQQPEAVPILNFLDVGSENYPIVRILANRNTIFVFKEVEGIFQITGTDPTNFIVSLFNDSAKIRAPESAVILNNKVFTFSDQGVISVDESGVTFISDPFIQATLSQISSSLYPNFSSATFGVSYETDRIYQFWTVSSTADTVATQSFWYSHFTNSWTRGCLKNRKAAYVLPSNDKEYFSDPDDLYIYQERKNFDRTDYADREIATYIAGFNGETVFLSDSPPVTIGTTDLVNTDSIIGIDLNLMVSLFEADSTVILKHYCWKDVNGVTKDESDFASSAGWSEVTTDATISYDDSVTILKTTSGFTNGGIFRTMQKTAEIGDVISFQFQFSHTASFYQAIIVLSNDNDLSQFGTYRVGIDTYLSGAQYFMAIRDDGVNDFADTYEIFPDTLYEVTFTVQSDGTLQVGFQEMVEMDLEGLEGSLLKQNDLESIIETVDDSLTVEVSTFVNWEVGSASIFEMIPCKIQWLLNPAGDPGILKHYPEATFFFKDAPFNQIDVGFQTDLVDSTEKLALMTQGQGWGEFPWGDRPWGVPGGRALNIRTLIPLSCQRASWINVLVQNREAYSNPLLAGVSVNYIPMSSRQR